MPPLIRTRADLQALLLRLEGAQSVALDTEFHGERSYRPRPMLVQLCPDGAEAWLVDALEGPPLQDLGAVLARKHLVVHGGGADLEILRRLTGVLPADVFDTQVAAGFCGLGWPIRLPDLAMATVGRRMAKTETVSDWSRRPLTADQVRYAELDVAWLGEIEAVLLARIPVELHTAVRECSSELLRRAVEAEDPGTLWHAVGGSHLLGPRERATLRRLAAWRDQAARSRDVPRHSILGDAHLLDLARRRPETAEELRNNRRLPSAFARSFGPEVLAEIAASNDDPAPPARFGAPRLELDLLQAAARLVEADTGVAAELVLPTTLLAAIAAGDRPDGWRKAVVGDRIDDYISGRIGISFPGRWIEVAHDEARIRVLASETE